MAEPNDPNKPIGKELTGRIGKYEIVRPLGKGAMGQVYLAHDTVLDRDVALKVMVAQIADDPELKARFEREAKAVAKMTHRNVVTVFDLGSHEDGSPYIAMELLRGQDLQKAVRQTPPMSLEQKVTVIVQVLAGLAHAHQAGIVHRDIKPANIFIQEDGSVKIMDFGVAHVTAASMTGTGNVVGTADYMSPEQVQGKKVDGRSDLFSVGCMLFELAAGRRPFHSDNLMAIFYKITHEDANFDLIPQGADYDALMPILKKALAKGIEGRYQTAYEFAVDLREWLKAHATTASAQNVLEALVDLEAPTHAPLPMTEAPGLFDGGAGATVDLNRRGGRKGTLAQTRAGGRTVVEGGAVPTMRPGATRVVTAPPVPRAPARPAPAPRPSVLPWVAVVLALVAVGVAGYHRLEEPAGPGHPPGDPGGRDPGPAADDGRDPHAAPGHRGARPHVRGGRRQGGRADPQRAGRVQGRELRPRGGRRPGGPARGPRERERAEGPRERAERAEGPRPAAGRGGRPRPRRLRRRRERARRRPPARPVGQRRRGLLPADRGGEGAGPARGRDQGAVGPHCADERRPQPGGDRAAEQAVRGGDRRVRPGCSPSTRRTPPPSRAAQAAIGAKAIAEAAPSGPRTGSGKTFVPGRTEAKGTEQGGLVGFEDSAGVNVKKGTAAAELPGRIVFEASPPAPKAGEPLPGERRPRQRGAAGDPPRLDDRRHRPRRQAPERPGSPLRHHRGARPAGAGLPVARAGLEGGHRVLDDGDRAPHHEGRDVPEHPRLEVARPGPVAAGRPSG